MRRPLLTFNVPPVQAGDNPRPEPQPANTAEAGPLPLSWDAEDRAIAAARCPWHPDADFPNTTDLIRHVVGHARAWEAEAIHAEQLRQSLEGQVREFTGDVTVMAASILGEEAP